MDTPNLDQSISKVDTTTPLSTCQISAKEEGGDIVEFESNHSGTRRRFRLMMEKIYQTREYFSNLDNSLRSFGTGKDLSELLETARKVLLETDDFLQRQCDDIFELDVTIKTSMVHNSSSRLNEHRQKLVEEQNLAVSDMVELNVGGTNVSTTRQTLTSIPGTALDAMFNNRFPKSAVTDKHGRYFLDRDYRYFKYVLNYLRDGKLRLPNTNSSKIQIESIFDEFDYFCVPIRSKDIVKGAKFRRSLCVEDEDTRPVALLAPVDDGEGVVTVSRDGVVKVWKDSECSEEYKIMNKVHDVDIKDCLVVCLGSTNHQGILTKLDLTTGEQATLACYGMCLKIRNNIAIMGTERGMQTLYLDSLEFEMAIQTMQPITHVDADERYILSVEAGQNIKLWNPNTYYWQKNIVSHQHCIVAKLVKGSVVTAHADYSIKVFDIDTTACVRTLHGHELPVMSLSAFHEKSMIVSGASDHTLKIWDLETGTCCRTLKLPKNNEAISLYVTAKGNCHRIFVGTGSGYCVFQMQVLQEFLDLEH